jgi:hypothetical protein
MHNPIKYLAALWLVVLTLFAAATLQTGCSTTGAPPPTVAQIVTPARVEAVTALAAQEKRDLGAVALALEAGGLTWLSSPEGRLALSIAASLFVDNHGPDTVLSNAYADAILTGALRGIDYATGQTSARLATRGSPEDDLLAAARATRPGP